MLNRVVMVGPAPNPVFVGLPTTLGVEASEELNKAITFNAERDRVGACWRFAATREA